MTHNARIRKDADWVVGPPVDSTEWLAIDTNLTKAVNGAGGGTWNPSAHLAIGGAGMWFAGAANSFTGTNSRINTNVAGNALIVHGDNDHILLKTGHTGATRALIASWSEARYEPRMFEYDVTHDRITSLIAGANAILKIPVHNGARIASVQFDFVVGSSHGPPAVLPQFRVFALDGAGHKTILLPNNSTNYTQFVPQPANAAAWYAGGAVQGFLYAIDSAVIVADTSKYSYFAEIIDEQGAGSAAGNSWSEVIVTVSDIPDLRPQ